MRKIGCACSFGGRKEIRRWRAFCAAACGSHPPAALPIGRRPLPRRPTPHTARRNNTRRPLPLRCPPACAPAATLRDARKSRLHQGLLWLAVLLKVAALPSLALSAPLLPPAVVDCLARKVDACRAGPTCREAVRAAAAATA